MTSHDTRGRARTVLTAAAVAALAATVPGEARACAAQPYIGSVCITAATFCPDGTHIRADGQLVPVSQYQALFALVGTIYGGDGSTTFRIPNLQSRVPIGVGQGVGLRPIQPGLMSGVEERTMVVGQMPAHTHTAQAGFSPDGVEVTVEASQLPGGSGTPDTGNYIAGGTSIYRSGSPGPTAELGGVSADGGGGTVAVTIDSTGGGQSFNTYDPSIGLTYCIAVEGIFPSRP